MHTKENLNRICNLIVSNGNNSQLDSKLKTFLLCYKQLRSTDATLSASPLGSSYSEGNESHRALTAALTRYLKRNLRASERKRLAWLVNGDSRQLNTVSLTQQTAHRAALKVSREMNLAHSKAIKSIA